ncbi:MAG: TadA family conjugal transfer-associated ATPase [Rothia sp. (in: high G+C Gram-positive bacteria)]|nr:TadA family conjugal transfer-associated ATPase [Rothia sp. (in: high G+C Gram-positive bacteria)]
MPLPSNTGLPTNTEPPVQQGYATAPEPARSPVPQAPPSLPGAELNPADPVNLRALLGQAETPLNQQETKEAETLLRAALTGLGPLEPLLATPELTDIFVNGTEVWFEAAGTLKRSEITLENDDETRALAVRLLTAAGGRLDDAHPIADAQTHTGLRVHAVLSPLSRKGTLLSIRARATNTPTLENLRQRGMFPHSTEQLLRYLVETRANFLISGGTGTGKTTLLSALLGACGHQDRLLLVEDTAELAPEHPHAVSLQAREANTEGRGEVSLAELIRAALRMRPTRLIVGECRGAEVVDMLTAMNTGHSGTGATVHANSAAAVPARLYAMGALGGLSQEALALQAATALDYIVHIDRCGGERKIRELARLELHEGQLTAVPVARTETGRRGDYLHWLPAGTGLKADFEEWGTP